jgi:hypothetical protein
MANKNIQIPLWDIPDQGYCRVYKAKKIETRRAYFNEPVEGILVKLEINNLKPHNVFYLNGLKIFYNKQDKLLYEPCPAIEFKLPQKMLSACIYPFKRMSGWACFLPIIGTVRMGNFIWILSGHSNGERVRVRLS